MPINVKIIADSISPQGVRLTTFELEDVNWFPVTGFEGYYECTIMGQIRSVTRQVRNSRNPMCFKTVTGKLLKQSSGIYRQVSLSKEGVTYKCYVHQLIAKTFDGNSWFEGCCVNHKDGNKHNNSAFNLEYITYSENNKHAFKMGLKKPSFGGGRKKVTHD